MPLTIEIVHEAGGGVVDAELRAQVRHVVRVDEARALLQKVLIRVSALQGLEKMLGWEIEEAVFRTNCTQTGYVVRSL